MNAFARAARGLMVGALCAAGALSIGAAASAQGTEPKPSFGVPPSGEIPILFNDHHVFTKPDTLRHGRTLVAIVRKNTIMVPMRSMFEQTGASVSYDPSTRTVDVSKPGADVKVSVGKAWVVVNGQERPLDVPPEIYKGSVVVPLRVISEGMGAYVQWVPEKHLVVVRYVEQVPEVPPATPPPTPRPTVPPTPVAATPTPAPAKAEHYEHYVAGDYMTFPKEYNELSAGNTGTKSFTVKGAVEFPLFGQTFDVDANYRHYLYAHYGNIKQLGCSPGQVGCNTVLGNDPVYQRGLCPSPNDPGCVTTVGYQQTQAQSGLGQIYVTSFIAQENDVDAHLAIKVANPRIYVGVGDYTKSYDYLGYPTISGFGFGFEKLPDLDAPFSVYGSAFYYPRVSGKYTYATSTLLGSLSGSQITLAYGVWKYEIGGTVALGKNLFLDFGYLGEKANARDNAPSGTSVNAPYVGLGLHF